MSKALHDIEAERQRQRTKHRWTAAHDDTHTDGQLAKAAACYAHISTLDETNREMLAADKTWAKGLVIFKRLWPRDFSYFKPSNPRRELVKAGALILAEIERLDRMESDRQGRNHD